MMTDNPQYYTRNTNDDHAAHTDSANHDVAIKELGLYQASSSQAIICNESAVKTKCWQCSCVRGLTTHPLWLQLSPVMCLVVVGLTVWGSVYSVIEDPAAPGGPLFNIAVLCIAGQVAGWAISFIHLPPLLGMLLMGILLRNVGFVYIEGPYVHLAVILRKMALSIILIRAGLGLDPVALKRLSGMVVRLAVIPSLVEISILAVMTHYLLDMPWIWGFLLGAVMAAVSPAVVIPCLFNLQAQGYGTAKGIPTLIVAAASFDDIIAISVFGTILSVIFSTGDITTQIIVGPVGLVMGLAFGFIWGILASYIPSRSDSYVVSSRTCVIGGGGLLAILGSEVIGYDGAGPLGCIVAAFVASYGWRAHGSGEDVNPVADNFALIWKFFQPILFCLIGTEVDVFLLESSTVGLGIASLFVALIMKMLFSILVAIRGGLNWKEKLFVGIAWFPKATVQAALGPVALDIARSLNSKEDIDHASKLLIVAVLAILVTAPLGAMLITLLGPRLLSRTPPVIDAD